jgi:hypothetical protein
VAWAAGGVDEKGQCGDEINLFDLDKTRNTAPSWFCGNFQNIIFFSGAGFYLCASKILTLQKYSNNERVGSYTIRP